MNANQLVHYIVVNVSIYFKTFGANFVARVGVGVLRLERQSLSRSRCPPQGMILVGNFTVKAYLSA